jgi:hypothetical protein
MPPKKATTTMKKPRMSAHKPAVVQREVEESPGVPTVVEVVEEEEEVGEEVPSSI